MHANSHAVIRLQYHLPNMQSTLFNEDASLDSVLETESRTMLTEFFELCKMNEEAKNSLYIHITKQFWWDKSLRIWKKRQRLQHKTICRLYASNPSQGERYYLRLLLTVVKGPTSFEDLRSYEDNTYETFQEAANARGLLADDKEWDKCLKEATFNCSPKQIRHLFSTILLFAVPTDPSKLFNKYVEAMSDDFLTQNKNNKRQKIPMNNTIKAKVAMNIEEYLLCHGKEWLDYNLPFVDFDLVTEEPRRTLLDEETSSYDEQEMKDLAAQKSNLNTDQKAAFDAIIESSTNDQGNAFFIDGPGGHGKTYLLNTILGDMRKNKHVALAVASSGIASLLLSGGRTAHNRFKIPINLLPESTCNISKQSMLAALIRKVKLIIWDEAPMTHRYAMEALNRSLQDICNSTKPFGGKTMVFAGDFRQILPVIPHGHEAEIIDACINKSVLWRHVQTLQLTENMRLDEDSRDRNAFLLSIGDGTCQTNPDMQNFVKLPDEICTPCSLENLIQETFGDINENTDFTNKVILTPKNVDVHHINDEITKQFPGTTKEYYSFDYVQSDSPEDFNYAPSFLNTLTVNGVPPHELKMKDRMPLILLRNLSPKEGLMNGTRLKLLNSLNHLLHCEILTGPCKGKFVYIPRINFTLTKSQLPFTLCRRQFPVQVAFAITINKSQGQTIQHVGIYLPKPVFSHGQLYVALSRCPSFSTLRIYIGHTSSDGYHTANIVYDEVFR